MPPGDIWLSPMQRISKTKPRTRRGLLLAETESVKPRMNKSLAGWSLPNPQTSPAKTQTSTTHQRMCNMMGSHANLVGHDT